MKKTTYLIFALFALAAQITLAGDIRNDIPSCYKALKINSAMDVAKSRQLIVVIDETVVLSKALQDDAYKKVIRFSKPGDEIRLYNFSAYLTGRHFSLPFLGQLEVTLAGRERNNTSMALVKQLDKCIENQQVYLKKAIGKAMLSSFGQASTEIARSEIFTALQQIGKDLSINSSDKEVVILLISDMLENSDFSSFYANQKVKDINVKTEIDLIKKSNLSARLDGARVFVMGAGLVNHNVPHGYRSGKTIKLLETFWDEYFELSGAHLMAFGAPELTVDLH